MGHGVLGVIPARGGSKRLPRKNVKLLHGKPLIVHTIEAALNSTRIDRVIVTTNDDEITSIAHQCGAEVPFRRPEHLADDLTTVGSVVSHAVAWLAEHEHYHPLYVTTLQPSSPLRTSQHIDEAVALCATNQADGILSVCEPGYSPYWMQRVVDGHLQFLLDEGRSYERKQDLPPVYQPNGAIYIYPPQVLANHVKYGRQGLLCLNTAYHILPYVMRREDSINIDTDFDFKLAELFFPPGE